MRKRATPRSSSASPRRSTARPAQQKVTDIEADIAAVHTALQSAKERHQQTNSMLQQLLQQRRRRADRGGRGQILALQTSLQATLQTTAMLLRTNLLEYL